jgi:hypothetical protein
VGSCFTSYVVNQCADTLRGSRVAVLYFFLQNSSGLQLQLSAASSQGKARLGVTACVIIGQLSFAGVPFGLRFMPGLMEAVKVHTLPCIVLQVQDITIAFCSMPVCCRCAFWLALHAWAHGGSEGSSAQGGSTAAGQGAVRGQQGERSGVFLTKL